MNFVWLERKVKEWGCMQALIDFDGWRKWKDFSSASDAPNEKFAPKSKPLPPTLSATSPSSVVPPSPLINGTTKPSQDEQKKNKRRSMSGIKMHPPPLPEEESTASPDAEDETL